jgi:hypothetical protein
MNGNAIIASLLKPQIAMTWRLEVMKDNTRNDLPESFFFRSENPSATKITCATGQSCSRLSYLFSVIDPQAWLEPEFPEDPSTDNKKPASSFPRTSSQPVFATTLFSGSPPYSVA